MTVISRPAVRVAPRVVTKSITVKTVPKINAGKPIVKNDTHVAPPKSNAFGTGTNSRVSHWFYYPWLFSGHHSNAEQTTTQEERSDFDKKTSANILDFSLAMMTIALIVAAVVWWKKRR